jgi:hypothetical protein
MRIPRRESECEKEKKGGKNRLSGEKKKTRLRHVAAAPAGINDKNSLKVLELSMLGDDDEDFTTTLDTRTVVVSVRLSSLSSSIKYKALLHCCSSIPRSHRHPAPLNLPMSLPWLCRYLHSMTVPKRGASESKWCVLHTTLRGRYFSYLPLYQSKMLARKIPPS